MLVCVCVLNNPCFPGSSAGPEATPRTHARNFRTCSAHFTKFYYYHYYY